MALRIAIIWVVVFVAFDHEFVRHHTTSFFSLKERSASPRIDEMSRDLAEATSMVSQHWTGSRIVLSYLILFDLSHGKLLLYVQV